MGEILSIMAVVLMFLIFGILIYLHVDTHLQIMDTYKKKPNAGISISSLRENRMMRESEILEEQRVIAELNANM